jgi:pilus assembly protein CpaE
LIEFHPEIEVVGEAATAKEAMEKAKLTTPDVILMDINMPGMDGIAATEVITEELPEINIIMMSVQGEQEYLRRAMIAGAKNYLIKPFTSDELLQAVTQAYNNEQKRKNALKNEKAAMKKGQIITVFSTKGGVGKTTISTNLAVALGELFGGKVGVLDADLQFGDIALFLNIMPKATIFDLVRDIDSLDSNLLESYLTSYNDNVQVLAAPFRPEQADAIAGNHLTTILKTMVNMFDYVVIDTAPVFNEVMLSVLDAADCILVVSSLDLPSIKNVKICLEIMESLHYPPEKIKIVLNRDNSEGGIETSEVEESFHQKLMGTLPSDGKIVLAAVNKGIPFVLSHPETMVAQGVYKLAKAIVNEETEVPVVTKGMVSRLKQLFR